MKIEFKSKPVTVIEQYVYIDGRKFEFWPLYRLLDQIRANYQLALLKTKDNLFLQNKGIIDKLGNRRTFQTATLGENAHDLLEMMDNKINIMDEV